MLLMDEYRELLWKGLGDAAFKGFRIITAHSTNEFCGTIVRYYDPK